MIENLKLDNEAACLSAGSMQSVSKAKYQLMRVMSSFGDITIKAVRCTIKGWQGIYLADRVTGTLYREEDGVCLTSTARRIVGPADKPIKAGALEQVRAEEREACAKVCDDNHWEDHRLFADAIRARGHK